jgi:ABC-2 type transport system ATP-binding protein
MGGEAIFLVKDVTKRYANRTILEHVTFDVRRGEILGIIGSSGAGKTTLLHMLVGFVPSSLGEITLRELTPSGAMDHSVLTDQRKISRLYGFASQVPSFYERLTVLENLHYFGTMYGLSNAAIERNAETLLHLMGLKSSAHLLAQYLSGGMKRRLDIACALIHDPQIIILDEPTADLDPVLRAHVWEVIKHINARGTTVILSSHHLNDLDALCSRIAILKDGKLVAIDTPERLKSAYSKQQEILIETFPGDYDLIAKRLKEEHVTDTRRSGTYLAIRTESPEVVLTRLMAVLKRQGESLLDLKLGKPNLDTVFVTIYANKASQIQKNEHKVKAPTVKPTGGTR